MFFGFFDELGLRVGSGVDLNESPQRDISDRRQIARYLEAGTVLVAVPGIEQSPIDPLFELPGGGSILTDGEWIWPRIAAHVVADSHIDVPTDLLVVARQRGYVAAPLSDAQVEAIFARASGDLAVSADAANLEGRDTTSIRIEEVRLRADGSADCVTRVLQGNLHSDETVWLGDSGGREVKISRIRNRNGVVSSLVAGDAGLITFVGAGVDGIRSGIYIARSH